MLKCIISYLKAVIVVHPYGQSAKMGELMVVCEKYNVLLIEDAAESIGNKYKVSKME